jgi:hypothetical protein
MQRSRARLALEHARKLAQRLRRQEQRARVERAQQQAHEGHEGVLQRAARTAPRLARRGTRIKMKMRIMAVP